MIVCSCNVLTEKQILSTLQDDAKRPRSAGHVYRCLGCKPSCGRCLTQIRKLMDEAHLSECSVGCAVCPASLEQAVQPAREQRPLRISVPPARRFRKPATTPQPVAAVLDHSHLQAAE